MPIVVFACKSNSCRSQMAEGWARQWIEDQIDVLELTLQEVQDKEDEKIDALADNRWPNGIKEHIEILKDTIVVSVALDSSSVFNVPLSPSETEDILSSAIPSMPRKQVKSKAVDAMKDSGVDISSFQPKTIDEIMPIIRGKNDPSSALITPKLISGNTSLLENVQLNDMEGHDFEQAKPVDKLIVLCSCGKEMKYRLARRSKSVEEWSIDAPTTASKAGEGDNAYRRVSLEIKNEVNILMKSLLLSPCL